MTTLCSSEWNGTLASGQFQRWWSKTGTIPLYLIPLLFPLLNFKSPAIFARMNSLGEDNMQGFGEETAELVRVYTPSLFRSWTGLSRYGVAARQGN